MPIGKPRLSGNHFMTVVTEAMSAELARKLASATQNCPTVTKVNWLENEINPHPCHNMPDDEDIAALVVLDIDLWWCIRRQFDLPRSIKYYPLLYAASTGLEMTTFLFLFLIMRSGAIMHLPVLFFAIFVVSRALSVSWQVPLDESHDQCPV